MNHMSIVLLSSAVIAGTTLFARGGAWVTEGFEQFRRGTFGNAGQNIYVSKAGVLQRIYQYDLDHNGWFDLAFANCQNHHESPPSYLYDLDGRKIVDLPCKGAIGATVTDLDGDGVTDIVLGGRFDQVSPFAVTDIYYGAPDEEYSEKYQIKIQSPYAVDCWHGRFNGAKRPSLAFAMKRYGIVRIYDQTELGFEWRKFTDLPITAALLTATDLDGDGFDDLVTRGEHETRTSVYWGGPDGLSVSNVTELAELDPAQVMWPEAATGLQSEMEQKTVTPMLLQCVVWNGRNCFTLSTGRKMVFFSATKDRRLERVFEIEVPLAYAVTAGDFNSDGLVDLAFAAQVRHPTNPAKQASFVWFNSKDGFVAANRVALETESACCIDSDGPRILIGQAEAKRSYTNDALLFTVKDGKVDPEPRRFPGENMHRVLFVKSPGRDTRVLVVNNAARSSVGFDRSYVYWGEKDGYDPKRRTEVASWCAVDAMAADLDDDGWAELVIGNNSENSLDLDPGNHLHHFGPDGHEPARTQIIPTDIGWGTVTGDFNRDGYLDLIAAADHWHNLRFFPGGPDGFRDYETIEVLPIRPPKRKGPERDDTGDVMTKAKKTIKVAEGGGMRWFIAVDVNADGWLDLAVTTCADRQYILWGGPEGFSMKRRQDVAGVMCTGVRAADLSKNGYPDVIFGGHTSQPDGKTVYREPHHSYAYVFWNGPKGISESRKSTLRTDAASHLCVGDFDGNGWLDLFTSSYTGELDRDINSFIYWNRGGSFRQFDRQDLITHAVSGAVALDFNEDGYVDLALANHKVFCDHQGYSEVWWNGKEGFLPTRTTKLPTCGPHGMYAIEPCNLLTRGPEEYYTSEAYVADRDLTVASARAEGEVPPKCWTKILLRANGGSWREPAGFKAKTGDRLQYRLELGALNSLRSPRITKVVVDFE